ncbi:MAG TPA: hypothetical protein VMY79_03400 [Dehalococcoidia bacterium]|nr:hypothetical protein [Dehalococcoidia bacterium]
MDWSSALSIIVGILLVIGLPLAFRKRKKVGPQKSEEFCQHLQKIGIKAYLVQMRDNREKIGQTRSSGEKSMGIIELKDRNIDSINVTGVTSQYGTHYFINYLVRNPNMVEKRKLKKTRLVSRKSSRLWGKVVAIEWKGDESLSRSLDFDYGLENKLLCSELKDLTASISIFPEPKHEYARIRTAYFLPSSEAFETIGMIARHVKSW